MSETDQSPIIPRYPTGLKPRGKRLWNDLHRTGDFTGWPETEKVAEEACYLVDEIARLRRVIRRAGADTRVTGYNGQPVSMPEVADLQRNQSLLLQMLKALRMPEEDGGDGKLSRSQVGKIAASARWHA